jgi:hypothetical protein
VAEYPEHAKLAAVSDRSQAIGEFLDWLGAQGVHLQRWGPVPDERLCPVFDCVDGRLRSASGRDKGECGRCGGTGWAPEDREAWHADGRSIQALLADYFGIDQARLEREKRTMLDELRHANRPQDPDELAPDDGYHQVGECPCGQVHTEAEVL